MTPAKARSPRYAAYVVGVLLAAYVLAFVDRQILNLLVEPIKRDLGLDDVQISLLQGLSFALCLAVAGLPIARLIDRGRRVGLLSLGIAAWSVMTAACGMAGAYPPLLLARAGVGVGEATMTPSAYSIIGDAVSPRRLGLAAGVYAMGPYLGGGLALTLGGALLGAIPHGVVVPGLGRIAEWRAAFLVVGALGLPMALWVATLREPARRGAAATAPGWNAIGAYFRSNAAALTGVNGAVAACATASYALSAWAPSTLIRAYHLTAAEAGRGFGFTVIVCGAAGALSAGVLGDFLRARGLAAGRLIVLTVAAVCATPFLALAPVAPDAGAALLLLAPALFFLTLAIASGPATLQEVTPNRLRGVQHAVAVLVVNLIGLGTGPTLVALVTEHGLHDPKRVGEALALTTPVMTAVGAAIALLALRPYASALRHAEG